MKKNDFTRIRDLPLTMKFGFPLRYGGSCSETASSKCVRIISLNKPFDEASGVVSRYPPMWEDLTDIWVRYRVISVDVKVVYFPKSSASDPLVCVMYPFYNTVGTEVPNIDGV